MSVVTMALQGKEQSLIGIHQVAAVDEQIADFSISLSSNQLSANDFRDALQGILLMLHNVRKNSCKDSAFLKKRYLCNEIKP